MLQWKDYPPSSQCKNGRLHVFDEVSRSISRLEAKTALLDERCRFCGKKVSWRLSSGVMPKDYLLAHAADYLQPQGPSEHMFQLVWGAAKQEFAKEIRGQQAEADRINADPIKALLDEAETK